MPKKTPIINDFRSGELAPDLDARADLKDYYRGCRILENAMPIIEGGVARVPGTYYVRPVKTDEGWNIRVTKSGTGTGVVTSDVAGIDCGSGCYAFFLDGATIVLTATPDSGMSFAVWSGDGTGIVTRTVLMDGNKTVNAEFELTIDFRCRAVTNDGTFLYLGGARVLSGNYYFRVEKRLISDGRLVTSLDYMLGPDANLKLWTSIAVDDTDVYLGGYYIDASSDYKAVIHKVPKTLVSITAEYEYPSVAGDKYIIDDICLDTAGVFFAGSKINSAVDVAVFKGRIPKSDITTPTWVLNNTLSQARGITISGDYVYIHKNITTSVGLEKVAKSDGSISYDSLVAGATGGYTHKGQIYNGQLYVAGASPTIGTDKAALYKINVSVPSLTWEQFFDDVALIYVDYYHQAIVDGVNSRVYVIGTSPYATRSLYSCHDLNGVLKWQLLNDVITRRGFCLTYYGDFLYVPVEEPSGVVRRFYLEKRDKADGSLIWTVS